MSMPVFIPLSVSQIRVKVKISSNSSMIVEGKGRCMVGVVFMVS